MAEPARLARSSVRVVQAKALRPCTCLIELRPHLATLEIKYRRGTLRAVRPACEASLYVETRRLLATDVVADDEQPEGVAVDVPVRFVRVIEEPTFALPLPEARS